MPSDNSTRSRTPGTDNVACRDARAGTAVTLHVVSILTSLAPYPHRQQLALNGCGSKQTNKYIPISISCYRLEFVHTHTHSRSYNTAPQLIRAEWLRFIYSFSHLTPYTPTQPTRTTTKHANKTERQSSLTPARAVISSASRPRA